LVYGTNEIVHFSTPQQSLSRYPPGEGGFHVGCSTVVPTLQLFAFVLEIVVVVVVVKTGISVEYPSSQQQND
jgi:hypothetical protein